MRYSRSAAAGVSTTFPLLLSRYVRIKHALHLQETGIYMPYKVVVVVDDDAGGGVDGVGKRNIHAL